MEMKVQVAFQQLITLVKTLTPTQKARLRQELDNDKSAITDKDDDFISFLLNGPIARKILLSLRKTEKALQHGGQKVNH